MYTESCRWWDCSDRKIGEWTSEGELKSILIDAIESMQDVSARYSRACMLVHGRVHPSG